MNRLKLIYTILGVYLAIIAFLIFAQDSITSNLPFVLAVVLFLYLLFMVPVASRYSAKHGFIVMVSLVGSIVSSFAGTGYSYNPKNEIVIKKIKIDFDHEFSTITGTFTLEDLPFQIGAFLEREEMIIESMDIRIQESKNNLAEQNGGHNSGSSAASIVTP